jgi:GMP synthase (glutamine-hydrolysing)
MPGDAMALHERACIMGRVEFPVDWEFRNAVTTPAAVSWLSEVDAVIIGGSGDFSVYDPRGAHWVRALVQCTAAVLERDIPLLGICFGHQILGTCLGETVVADSDTAEIGTCTYQLTEAGEKDNLFGILPKSFRAQAGHSDSVQRVPAGVTVMAINPRLQTQAFRVDGSRCSYSVQFHPDMSAKEARERYLAYRLGFEHASPSAAAKGAEQFVLGTDESTQLIPRFLSVAKESC